MKTLETIQKRLSREEITKTVKTFQDYVKTNIDKGDDYLKEHFKGPYEKVEKVIVDLKERREKIEKTAKDNVNRVYENGKNTIMENSLVKTTEKKISEGLKSIPGLINLPTREDIDNLRLALETLNNNVSNINRKNAA